MIVACRTTTGQWAYFQRAPHVLVVFDTVEGKFAEQVRHQDCGRIKEAFQLPKRDKLTTVSLVENVLYFRKPPDERKGREGGREGGREDD